MDQVTIKHVEGPQSHTEATVHKQEYESYQNQVTPKGSGTKAGCKQGVLVQ